MRNFNETPDFPDIKISNHGNRLVLNTADNLKALLKHSSIEAKFNLMTLESDIFLEDQFIGAPELIRSELISLAAIHDLPKAAIDDHFAAVARDAPYHPVADWLSGEWDGVARIDKALDCLKPKNSQLAKSVLKHWLVGCVASLLVPNFKSKLVPVLQGGQSFKKTAFVERIANVLSGAFLEGAELNPDNKDSVLSVIRSWVVELGELERSTKNCQGSLKAFITRSCDTVRPPYGRNDIKKRRQTNLIATVNESEFLKDETGNTRYAVIELIGETDMDLLNQILGWEYKSTGELVLNDPECLRQFWLEVKYLFQVEKHPWVLPTEIATKVFEESSKFADKGQWYGVVVDHLNECNGKGKQWLTTKQVCEELKVDISRSSGVGKCLSRLSSEGKLEKKMLNGTNRYLFPTVIDCGGQ
ncbi:VapE domain-containing protein [Vibrio ulleungensis]|uniref:Virulence protein n=1 Tax=Vibrio ulleungensis TaxID=2807619 RepID=A0ABS2HNH0_9VIBR|nr:VapE domain-containing protein [Vibrio ulleungensis]MBM7037426.1 virulence protein [Vibrio ulleungensis]